MSVPGENAQLRATAVTADATRAETRPAEPKPALEWQGELDSAMRDIDTRLKHPRRRASDSTDQPTLPQLGQVELTSELLDEIAWRVSEQMRRSMPFEPETPTSATPAQHAAATPSMERERMMPGIAVSIRIRRPLFRFRFWRRRVRRESLMQFSDYRIT